MLMSPHAAFFNGTYDRVTWGASDLVQVPLICRAVPHIGVHCWCDNQRRAYR